MERATGDRAVDPAHETGVSTGVHELRLWTSVDRRYRYFEGWFEAFYQRPIAIRSTALFNRAISCCRGGRRASGSAAMRCSSIARRRRVT